MPVAEGSALPGFWSCRYSVPRPMRRADPGRSGVAYLAGFLALGDFFHTVTVGMCMGEGVEGVEGVAQARLLHHYCPVLHAVRSQALWGVTSQTIRRFRPVTRPHLDQHQGSS